MSLFPKLLVHVWLYKKHAKTVAMWIQETDLFKIKIQSIYLPGNAYFGLNVQDGA